jgi:hypothetical protein
LEDRQKDSHVVLERPKGEKKELLLEGIESTNILEFRTVEKPME